MERFIFLEVDSEWRAGKGNDCAPGPRRGQEAGGDGVGSRGPDVFMGKSLALVVLSCLTYV